MVKCYYNCETSEYLTPSVAFGNMQFWRKYTNIELILMPHSLVCWRCGASLAELSLPLRRLEVCKACNAELHVCKMCVEYDTSYAKHCKEPIAEEVRKKDEANFCDFFKPKAGAYVAKDTAELARAKSALDDLFKK
jgi:hypothetical protein